MKFGKFIFGLGIGVAAGLLLAPKKGSELREDIKRESLKAYDNVKNMTKEDVEALLGQTIENVKKSVDEFDVDEFKASTKLKLESLEAKLQNFADHVRESEQYVYVKDNIVDLAEKVNTKVNEVKDNVLSEDDLDDVFDALEDEIDDVEDKPEEVIEVVKD